MKHETELDLKSRIAMTWNKTPKALRLPAIFVFGFASTYILVEIAKLFFIPPNNAPTLWLLYGFCVATLLLFENKKLKTFFLLGSFLCLFAEDYLLRNNVLLAFNTSLINTLEPLFISIIINKLTKNKFLISTPMHFFYLLMVPLPVAFISGSLFANLNINITVDQKYIYSALIWFLQGYLSILFISVPLLAALEAKNFKDFFKSRATIVEIISCFTVVLILDLFFKTSFASEKPLLFLFWSWPFAVWFGSRLNLRIISLFCMQTAFAVHQQIVNQQGIFWQKNDSPDESLISAQLFLVALFFTVYMIGVLTESFDKRTKEAEKLNEELIRESKQKDEFLANLSHELRTPLNSIYGWSEILKDSLDNNNYEPDQFKKGMDTIYRNALSEISIVDQLIEMSQIITGKFKLDCKRISLNKVVLEVIDMLEPLALEKQVSILKFLPAEETFTVGDFAKLKQVVWNILQNAIKFTPEKGEVEITLTAQNKNIELIISDNGIGIAPEFLPELFEKFRQFDSSFSREYEGLGLGLSIVKNIVELHKGSISAKSEGPGKGSEFIITFPLS